MNIEDLQTEVHMTAIEKGWWQEERPIPECLALIHSEVSEALEEYRDGRSIVHVDYEKGKPVGFPIELADIIIRVLDLAGDWGIDIANALYIKKEYNKTRPYRHGGKRC